MQFHVLTIVKYIHITKSNSFSITFKEDTIISGPGISYPFSDL